MPGNLVEACEETMLADLVNGKAKTLFYIPSSSEIMEVTKDEPV
jgi:hypothetical protein